MSLEKTRGIVLRSTSLGEADLLILLLTETGKKEKFIFKGLRKSKTRPKLAGEPGSFIEIDYYFHRNKDVFNAKEFSLLERFSRAKENYLGYLTLSFLLELNDKFLPGEENPIAFLLLKKALSALDEFGFQHILLPYYKWRFLLFQGFVSDEFNCTQCNSPLEGEEFASLQSDSLHIHCKKCSVSLENQIQIVKLLKAISSKKYSRIREEEIPLLLISSLDHILNHFFLANFSIELRSPELLYQSMANEKLELETTGESHERAGNFKIESFGDHNSKN
ncbi:MAG: DNA repair protein RecO [Leptospiraceae bacterium]|nr:DNA repair protein RecO [Leptospiraceae bacterium]MCP5510714.1 DNA repair protein RecO [Leptospiraceae bacterium]